MFTEYHNEKVMTMDGNIYLLQYGSYISKNVMEENVKKLDYYITYEEDGKYYVFIGAYINLENARKVSKIYEDRGIYTYIKNDYIGNSDIINKISKLEVKLENEDNIDKIYEVNKKILEILKTL